MHEWLPSMWDVSKPSYHIFDFRAATYIQKLGFCMFD
jgi:hypothetical protein